MLIEIPAAELLARTPEEGVSHVLSLCLKETPPKSFLARYKDAIKTDDLGFIENYLGQWPGVLCSSVAVPQRGADAMMRLEDIISTRFLMAIPSEQFLEVAYQEFFGREVDEWGREQHGSRDFAQREHREAVIASLAGSAEFVKNPRSRVLAGPVDLVQRLGKIRAPSLYWDERVAVSSEWYAEGPVPAALSGQYMPFLLWLPDRQHLYTLPGVHVMGELTENRLAAPPEWVFWGPKAPLSAGDYFISVDLEGEPSDLFLFDAVSEVGSNVHTSVKYFGSISLRIALKVEQPVRDFEIRLFNYTGRAAEVKLNELSLARR
jgi:hypothetical protein